MSRLTKLALRTCATLTMVAILGALWFLTVWQGWILLERHVARRFLSLPSDPVRTLATFNVVSILLAMSPWAALTVWVTGCWKANGSMRSIRRAAKSTPQWRLTP